MSCPQAPSTWKRSILAQPLRMRRMGTVLSVAIALWGGVAASASWADQTPRHFLLAQQIVDGLPPPPPPGSSPAPEVPVQPSEPGSLSPAPVEREFQSVPAVGAPIAPNAGRYVVLVNGSSPLLLEQVQRVEPGAFLQQQNGKSRIQAGAFSDQGSAEQRVQALAAQGIEAQAIAVAGEQMTPAASPRVAQFPSGTAAPPVAVPSPPEALPSVPVPREVVFGQQPALEQYEAPAEQTFDSRSAQAFPQQYGSLSPYYVVIPGSSADLRAISLRITQLAQGLNVQERAIVERERPRGPHVLVGPFLDRSTASDWNRYFRAFGLDARVYYNR